MTWRTLALIVSALLVTQLLPARPALATHTTISSNTTWTVANSPYVFNGDLVIASGATLTIEPGVVVKLNGTGTEVRVGGTLKALGSASAPVIFTSIKDDASDGIDSGGDGATTPQPGDWLNLEVESGNANTLLQYAVVRYAGYGSSSLTYGGIKVRNGSVPTLDNARIVDNQRAGISVSVGSGVVLRDSVVERNRHGVVLIGGWVDAQRSTFRDNAGDGVIFSLASSYTGPASVITRSEITGNLNQGVDVGADASLPDSRIPHGNFNNIYGNGDPYQLYTPGERLEIDWTSNYWGDGVVFSYNDSKCLNEDPFALGRLIFPGGGDGPLTNSQYIAGTAPDDVMCYYDKTRVYPGEFFTSKIAGAGAPVSMLTGGLHGVNPSGSQGDPVNSATGAYFTSATDLALPGIDVPFVFKRSYNSLTERGGVLGAGWRHSLEASLKLWPHGDIDLHAEDGQILRFEKQSDGSFEGGPGVRSKLVAVTGGYKVTRRDQVVYAFDSNGKLKSIKGRNGTGLTLAHGTDGNISTVTDSAGRVIDFSHNANGRLTQVALPDGRSVSYGYTNGLLTSVTDVRGNTTSYTYDSKQRLKTVVDQNNHMVVDNTYGADGRVSQQTDARGKLWGFSWNAAAETSTLTDPRGKQWVDDYDSNLLVSRTDPLGNKTSYSYDSDFNVAAVTDARNNTTMMTYGGRGNMLTRTAPTPLSYTETWTYNSNNDPLTYENRRDKGGFNWSSQHLTRWRCSAMGVGKRQQEIRAMRGHMWSPGRPST
ncbi:MAG: DUF6531 domain-containing protein, partial [Actinomycetota bacterium]